MSIEYHFDLYPRLTPVAGALVRRLVNLQQAEYRGEANGTGSGKIILRGNSADAAFLDPKGMQYIRVVRDDGATEVVVGGFFLENGDYEALTERSTKKLTFGGAGALSYLSRAIAAEETYIAGAEGPFDDTWHWYYSPAGSILWRMVTEALDPDRPQSPIAGVTLNFSQSLDSDGNAWPGYGTSWLFTAQVKEGLVPIMRRLLEAGLYVWMDPDTFELSAWMANAHGRDRTGLAWGANVVRFQAPTAATVATGNIKSDAKRGIGALLKRSDLLVGSAEGTEWVNDPSADLVWEGGYQVDDPVGTSLSQIGAAQLDARNDAGDTVRLRMMLDSSPTTGKYLPFEHVQLDDRVTLHTGTGQWDWNETEQKVAAISLKLRTGGDWDAWVDLGSKYSSIEDRAFANQPVGAHTHPPNPRLCDRNQSWNVPIEILLRQRWVIGAGDVPTHYFELRARKAGDDNPLLRFQIDYDSGADTLGFSTLQGIDQFGNETSYAGASGLIATPSGAEFYVRFRIEQTGLKARMWKVADAEPGAWQVEVADGGFDLVNASTINEINDQFDTQYPNPTAFYRSSLVIVSGFGTSQVQDDWSTDQADGWGTSTINGAPWQALGSDNTGVTGGEAFFIAASGPDTTLGTQLQIPSDEGSCPEPIGLACDAGTDTCAARGDHVHIADAASVTYSGGTTVEAALDVAAAVTASGFTSMAKWLTD